MVVLCTMCHAQMFITHALLQMGFTQYSPTNLKLYTSCHNANGFIQECSYTKYCSQCRVHCRPFSILIVNCPYSVNNINYNASYLRAPLSKNEHLPNVVPQQETVGKRYPNLQGSCQYVPNARKPQREIYQTRNVVQYYGMTK